MSPRPLKMALPPEGDRLEEQLKVYTNPSLLIIDEVGYLPMDKLQSNLLFQVISKREEGGRPLYALAPAPGERRRVTRINTGGGSVFHRQGWVSFRVLPHFW